MTGAIISKREDEYFLHQPFIAARLPSIKPRRATALRLKLDSLAESALGAASLTFTNLLLAGQSSDSLPGDRAPATGAQSSKSGGCVALPWRRAMAVHFSCATCL